MGGKHPMPAKSTGVSVRAAEGVRQLFREFPASICAFLLPHVRRFLLIASLFPFAPFLVTEGAAMSRVDVRSTVESNVRVNVNGRRQSVEQSSTEARSWTDADANAMRPFGTVISEETSMQISSFMRCRALAGEDRLTCLHEERSALSPFHSLVSAFPERQTTEAGARQADALRRCEEAMGKENALCAEDGALGTFLQRNRTLSDARFESVFRRWLRRLERRAGESDGTLRQEHHMF